MEALLSSVAIAAVRYFASRLVHVFGRPARVIATGLVLAGCVANESQPTSHSLQDTRGYQNQRESPSVARRAKIRNTTVIGSAKPSTPSPGAGVHAAEGAGRCETGGQCELLLKGLTAKSAPSNSAPPAPSETKEGTAPLATDNSEADHAGARQPRFKIQGTEANSGKFVTGAVPRAPTNVGALPAKLSERTTADDALPIAGYVLRHLTDEQRRAIFRVVRGNRVTKIAVASTGSCAMVGAMIPSSVALDGLSPLPEGVVATLPELRDVMFTSSGDKLLLVNPRLRMVVGVLGP
jgi:hypothetical protein